MLILSPPTVPEGMTDASMLFLIAFAIACPIAMRCMNVMISRHHELLHLILSPAIFRV
jgi:hypothetical protein